MHTNLTIQKALRHIHQYFPEVDQVFFGGNGRWHFCNSDFEAPDFDHATGTIDHDLLAAAANAASIEKGLPCAYSLLQLDDYYQLWDRLSAIPVSEITCGVEGGHIEEQFLHFPIGTHRESIWHWFEEQHPNFVVGEVLAGARRPDDGHLWKVTLRMKDHTKFEWEGSAHGPRCAEITARAEATEQTEQEVWVVLDVSIKRYFNKN